eukprot:UN07940
MASGDNRSVSIDSKHMVLYRALVYKESYPAVVAKTNEDHKHS